MAELKRSGGLQRKTELARGKGLSRPSPMARGGETVRTAARPKAARYTGPDAKTRALVLERDDHRCVCCGVSVIGRPYSLQHRKRRSQGGGNSPSNLITVLGTGTTGCHERIDSRRDPHDEARGYTVRSWQDPAEVPVMVMSAHGAGALMLLTADGTYEIPPEAAA
jgi:hypothetical protein